MCYIYVIAAASFLTILINWIFVASISFPGMHRQLNLSHQEDNNTHFSFCAWTEIADLYFTQDFNCNFSLSVNLFGPRKC